MRLVRFGALVGSLLLLVSTTVSMVNQRSQERAEQNARLDATVQLADQSVQDTIARALAVTGTSNRETDPAVLVRSFGSGTSACVATADDNRCTAGDLAATAAFGSGVSATLALDGPAVVVDESTDSLLAVSRIGDVTAALQLPSSTLIGDNAADSIKENDATVSVRLTSDASGDDGDETTVGEPTRTGRSSTDGVITVTDVLPLPGDGGAVLIEVAIDDDAGFLGDGFAEYVLLLTLGSVLALLAGWTFLADRRTLERRATTDDLTGLPNRREFERVTEEALLAAERFNTGLCIMLIDLNGFKQINDTLGHQFGDLVLRAAASRLRDAIRDTDVVGRWGGDEFVVLLPGVDDGSGVRASAERLARSLADTPVAQEVTVTAAIGAALFPIHGTTLDELVRAADDAMYGAKTTGVIHRLADIHSVDSRTSMRSTDYSGPDRRRSHADDHNRV